ncbi:MAG: hypothetical protein AAGD01_14030 [Acidobacteriota bacterium]
MAPEPLRVPFLGSTLHVVPEGTVRRHLSILQALDDLRAGLRQQGDGRSVQTAASELAWPGDRQRTRLRLCRAGLAEPPLVGGLERAFPAVDVAAAAGDAAVPRWMMVMDGRIGRPLALLEGDHLSRQRAAATVALATDLMAPPQVKVLAHVGLGPRAESLVKALMMVRPSLERVLVGRRRDQKETPLWLADLDVEAELVTPEQAVAQAQILTVDSGEPDPVEMESGDVVVPTTAAGPHLVHLNLLAGAQIPETLARRCLPSAGGFLVAQDPQRSESVGGTFDHLARRGELLWRGVPTLGELVSDEGALHLAQRAEVTALLAGGGAIADLALAAGVLRRLGIVE